MAEEKIELPPPRARRGYTGRLAMFTVVTVLVAVTIYQTRLLRDLRIQARAQIELARKIKLADGHRDALGSLRLVDLESKDAAYATARLAIAWDPMLSRGLVTTAHFPPVPAGHEYRLWILDPSAAAPIDGGTVPGDDATRPFSVPVLSTSSPGFALTLESGATPEPHGPTLFAVAPGQ